MFIVFVMLFIFCFVFIHFNALNRQLLSQMWCFAQFGIICIILKNVKNTRGGVLLLLGKYKSNAPQWVFLTIFKLHMWHQIAQSFSNITEYNASFPFTFQLDSDVDKNGKLSKHFIVCWTKEWLCDYYSFCSYLQYIESK